MISSRIQIETLPGLETGQDLLIWMNEQSKKGDLLWLLAHAEDGVIWGKWEAKRWQLSSDVDVDVSPPLRIQTLQQARLFGPLTEVFIWKEGANWCARRLRETGPGEQDCIDEAMVLWGTRAQPVEGGFTRLTEIIQSGMRHTVPVEVTNEALEKRRLRLVVRHYLDVDEKTGEARLGISRLVQLGLMAEG